MLSDFMKRLIAMILKKKYNLFFRIFVVQIKSGVWNMILHQDGPVVKCYLLELLIYQVNRYENCSKKWYFVLKIVLIVLL